MDVQLVHVIQLVWKSELLKLTEGLPGALCAPIIELPAVEVAVLLLLLLLVAPPTAAMVVHMAFVQVLLLLLACPDAGPLGSSRSCRSAGQSPPRTSRRCDATHFATIAAPLPQPIALLQ